MYKLLSTVFLLNLAYTISFGQNGKDKQAERTLVHDKTITEKLDEYLRSLSKGYKFNGSALIVQKGEILLKKGYGWKNAALNIASDTSSIYQIGSLTKPFTAEVILKLQELGKLSINDKLNKYLPDYPNGEKITIENLLTHTSGIANYDAEEKDTITWKPLSKSFIMDVFKDKPLEFKPGSMFRYSNSGFFYWG